MINILFSPALSWLAEHRRRQAAIRQEYEHLFRRKRRPRREDYITDTVLLLVSIEGTLTSVAGLPIAASVMPGWIPPVVMMSRAALLVLTMWRLTRYFP